MEYDFSKIQLFPYQIKLLKRLRRFGPQMSGELDVDDLFSTNLIQTTKRCREENKKEIEISDKGLLFLRWRREDSFRHRWPVYLSIAAIVLSGAAFIQSFFF